MMKRIYRVEQVRAAERATGEALTSGRLMAQAAAGLAREAVAELADSGRRVFGSRILLVAGPGDNGGDGLHAAALLARRGARVTAWCCFPTAHAGGSAALQAVGGRFVDGVEARAELARADLVIDAVFGIGARPGLPPAVAAFAADCRARGVTVVSVDLPSGLDADACRPAPATEDGPASFWADRTVSFGAWKPCHVFQPARERCGARRLIDIGLDWGSPSGSWGPVDADDQWAGQGAPFAEEIGHVQGAAFRVPTATPYAEEIELADLAARWPWPGPTSDKYSRGVVGIDTGSADYPGAAVLGVLGATHVGAGYVVYTGPARAAVLAAAPHVVCPIPSVDGPPKPRDDARLTVDGPPKPRVDARLMVDGPPKPRVDAWLIGSGWGARQDAAARLAEVLDEGVPVVIDAEGIGLFAAAPRRTPGGPPVLLTPHAGELAPALGLTRDQVEADPVSAVHEACRRTGATVLLKGATQYVATPDRATALVCFPGPAWTAQAGSGDVLAGIAVALLATGLPPALAAGLAGSIQALAATRHPGPYPPGELARFLPEVIASLSR